ncbi:MAG: SoxR reducing system RseC family protein [Candidatus Cloacimonetes bacterium]|nr:SoxR reducing system RseC family protein [Candidatus Cloacimonadota bacterium]
MSHHEHIPSTCDEETGIVVNSTPNDVWVERMSLEGCKSCAMSGVCGSKNTPQLKFKNDADYHIGDIVLIHISSSTRLMSSFIIFIVPVILLILTFALFYYVLNTSEKISILVGFLSLFLSALIIGLYDKYLAKTKAVSISKKDL